MKNNEPKRTAQSNQQNKQNNSVCGIENHTKNEKQHDIYIFLKNTFEDNRKLKQFISWFECLQT